MLTTNPAPTLAFPVLTTSTDDNQRTELLRAIVEHTASANSLWEPVYDEAGAVVNFRYLYVNPAAARYLNRTNEELAGRLVSDFNKQFHESGHAALFTNVFTTQVPYREEMLHPVLKRWLDMSVSRVGDVLLMSFYDIHERYEANRKAQEQAYLLQQVVNMGPSGMMLLEPMLDDVGTIYDFRYLITNELNAKMSGYTVDQMNGQHVSALFPGYQELDLFSTLVHVCRTGKTVENTFVYDNYGIKGTFDGYYLKQGEGVLFTYVNVTKLVEQQAQLTLMNRELLQSNESLQQFAYIASHDLQEPLRKVQSFGDMLAEQYADQLAGPGLEMISRMQLSARRMSELIRDLLNYARLTTEKVEPESVDLNIILDETLTDLAVRIEETQPTIQIDPLPTVSGQAVQLRQLFQNLLSNALKFQPQGQVPMVHVSCQPADTNQLPPELIPRRPYWKITVRDNGIGFQQNYADRIFEVFQRLHGKNKYVGTGVGLAVCRRVVENHAGTITAQSQPSAGATFIVYLPK